MYYKYDGTLPLIKWYPAYNLCAEDGARLPKFTTQEEYQAIMDLLGKSRQ